MTKNNNNVLVVCDPHDMGHTLATSSPFRSVVTMSRMSTCPLLSVVPVGCKMTDEADAPLNPIKQTNKLLSPLPILWFVVPISPVVYCSCVICCGLLSPFPVVVWSLCATCCGRPSPCPVLWSAVPMSPVVVSSLRPLWCTVPCPCCGLLSPCLMC